MATMALNASILIYDLTDKALLSIFNPNGIIPLNERSNTKPRRRGIDEYTGHMLHNCTLF